MESAFLLWIEVRNMFIIHVAIDQATFFQSQGIAWQSVMKSRAE